MSQLSFGLTLLASRAPLAGAGEEAKPSTVHVKLSEWKIVLDPAKVPPGPVQLQITSAPNTPALPAPGGFLFVNWEKSSGRAVAL